MQYIIILVADVVEFRKVLNLAPYFGRRDERRSYFNITVMADPPIPKPRVPRRTADKPSVQHIRKLDLSIFTNKLVSHTRIRQRERQKQSLTDRMLFLFFSSTRTLTHTHTHTWHISLTHLCYSLAMDHMVKCTRVDGTIVTSL